MSGNRDIATVEGFGREWTSFDQTPLSEHDLAKHFDEYFRNFRWEELPRDAVGFDLGCGSGRWAKCVAPKVGRLHCIDASEAALAVAAKNLRDAPNCRLHLASVDRIPLDDESMDFGYSLGVLHHVPDTAAAMCSCVKKLKPGAPFLVYLYYAFDNRAPWFKALWVLSDQLRRLISNFPYPLRYLTSQILAVLVYYPLARTAYLLEKCGVKVDSFPLSIYRNRSFYGMRTDALDRFGTKLEQRFTADAIRSMMESAGLERIIFNEAAPYWCALGFKKAR